MKKCKECGKDFEPKNPKGIFCSLSCRQKDYRKNKNKEFEGYRTAVANINPKPVTSESVQESTQTKLSIARGLSWYVKAIQGLEFDEEYRTMEGMILADKTLTKKEQADLILAMKIKGV